MKRIFLTGASSGIGLAVARSLVARGDEVWGTSRDPARIPQLPHLHGVELDLSDSNSIERAFNTAQAEAGFFDVVVNNAGSGYFGPTESLSPNALANQFQILVFAHAQLMRLALPAMRARGSGLIINVTSLASRLPVPFMAAYNAAKAAMPVFTMSIQLELGDTDVHLVDLQPADICTDFNKAVTKFDHDKLYSAKVAQAWKIIERNLRQAPKPELVASYIVKLTEQKNPTPRATVGDFFQGRIAPLIFRFLPQRLRIWGLKKYYGI